MYRTCKNIMLIAYFLGVVAYVLHWLARNNFAFGDLILLALYGVWAWWILRRPRPLQSFRYEVSVSKPEHHSSIHLIERS